jgi:hypothetical protein
MFAKSLDNKILKLDPNGNQIVDLTVGTISTNQAISNYTFRNVPDDYVMRPDLIALSELGSTDYAEYILMFNQIGNPFSIQKDDILMIPELIEAQEMTSASASNGLNSTYDSSIQDLLVKSYWKHAGNRAENTVDMDSYDKYENTEIPSGNVTEEPEDLDVQGVSTVPYLLDEGGSAIISKNGRIYLNDGNNNQGVTDITSGNIDAVLQQTLSNVATKLSDANCTYNGTNLADFIKALNDSSTTA